MNLFHAYGCRFQNFGQVSRHVIAYTACISPEMKMQVAPGRNSGVFFTNDRNKIFQLFGKRNGKTKLTPGVITNPHYTTYPAIGESSAGGVIEVDNQSADCLKHIFNFSVLF